MRSICQPTVLEDKSSFPQFRTLEISGVRYHFDHQVATGSSCQLFRARDEFGSALVLKQYKAGTNRALWESELNNLQRFKHPTVPYLYAAFEFKNSCYLILEEAGVRVKQLNFSDHTERERMVLHIGAVLLQILQLIHTKGYVHADINPNNILIKFVGKQLQSIKLCDWGLCKPVNDGLMPTQVALWHPPPEYYSTTFGGIGFPFDVYHAALVMLECLHGTVPTFAESEIVQGVPQEWASSVGCSMSGVLSQALATDVDRRPSAVALWRKLSKLAYGSA